MPKGQSHKCRECGKRFKDEFYLEKHMKKRHETLKDQKQTSDEEAKNGDKTDGEKIEENLRKEVLIKPILADDLNGKIDSQSNDEPNEKEIRKEEILAKNVEDAHSPCLVRDVGADEGPIEEESNHSMPTSSTDAEPTDPSSPALPTVETAAFLSSITETKSTELALVVPIEVDPTTATQALLTAEPTIFTSSFDTTVESTDSLSEFPATTELTVSSKPVVPKDETIYSSPITSEFESGIQSFVVPTDGQPTNSTPHLPSVKTTSSSLITSEIESIDLSLEDVLTVLTQKMSTEDVPTVSTQTAPTVETIAPIPITTEKESTELSLVVPTEEKPRASIPVLPEVETIVSIPITTEMKSTELFSVSSTEKETTGPIPALPTEGTIAPLPITTETESTELPLVVPTKVETMVSTSVWTTVETRTCSPHNTEMGATELFLEARPTDVSELTRLSLMIPTEVKPIALPRGEITGPSPVTTEIGSTELSLVIPTEVETTASSAQGTSTVEIIASSLEISTEVESTDSSLVFHTEAEPITSTSPVELTVKAIVSSTPMITKVELTDSSSMFSTEAEPKTSASYPNDKEPTDSWKVSSTAVSIESESTNFSPVLSEGSEASSRLVFTEVEPTDSSHVISTLSSPSSPTIEEASPHSPTNLTTVEPTSSSLLLPTEAFSPLVPTESSTFELEALGQDLGKDDASIEIISPNEIQDEDPTIKTFPSVLNGQEIDSNFDGQHSKINSSTTDEGYRSQSGFSESGRTTKSEYRSQSRWSESGMTAESGYRSQSVLSESGRTTKIDAREDLVTKTNKDDATLEPENKQEYRSQSSWTSESGRTTISPTKIEAREDSVTKSNKEDDPKPEPENEESSHRNIGAEDTLLQNKSRRGDDSDTITYGMECANVKKKMAKMSAKDKVQMPKGTKLIPQSAINIPPILQLEIRDGTRVPSASLNVNENRPESMNVETGIDFKSPSLSKDLEQITTDGSDLSNKVENNESKNECEELTEDQNNESKNECEELTEDQRSFSSFNPIVMEYTMLREEQHQKLQDRITKLKTNSCMNYQRQGISDQQSVEEDRRYNEEVDMLLQKLESIKYQGNEVMDWAKSEMQKIQSSQSADQSTIRAVQGTSMTEQQQTQEPSKFPCQQTLGERRANFEPAKKSQKTANPEPAKIKKKLIELKAVATMSDDATTEGEAPEHCLSAATGTTASSQGVGEAPHQMSTDQESIQHLPVWEPTPVEQLDINPTSGPGLASRKNIYSYIDVLYCQKERLQDWYYKGGVVKLTPFKPPPVSYSIPSRDQLKLQEQQRHRIIRKTNKYVIDNKDGDESKGGKKENKVQEKAFHAAEKGEPEAKAKGKGKVNLKGKKVLKAKKGKDVTFKSEAQNKNKNNQTEFGDYVDARDAWKNEEKNEAKKKKKKNPKNEQAAHEKSKHADQSHMDQSHMDHARANMRRARGEDIETESEELDLSNPTRMVSPFIAQPRLVSQMQSQRSANTIRFH